ncbi:MAG: hypothetical protein ACC633_00090 [Anaerolineales bacterium]
MSGLTEKIANANGFYIDALPANQRGELTPDQARSLISKLFGPLILILIPVVMLIVQLQRTGYVSGFSLTEPILVIFQQMTTSAKAFLGIMTALGLWGLVLLILLLLDIYGGQVKMIEGLGYRKMTTSTDDDGTKTTRMYYVIADKKFSVQRGGFMVFVDGGQYKAYFTPRRKILVNVEALE